MLEREQFLGEDQAEKGNVKRVEVLDRLSREVLTDGEM